MSDHSKEQLDTQLMSLGRDPVRDLGSVNPPVHRTSTVIFPNFEAFDAYEQGKRDMRSYGRYGTLTSDTLEEAVAVLEGADHAIATASGLAAITVPMLTFLNAGDHILVPDSIYSSARHFVVHELPRFGVEVEFYDPTIGAGIEKMIKKNTKIVYCESPGSLTFEMQDIPAISKAAKAHGAIVMLDSTWATPLLQKPYNMGVDISIHSATKYIGGHSDLVMGVITCRKELYPQLRRVHRNMGASTSSDNCYLALRGLRTMALRLKQHQENAVEVAKWLQKVPEVSRVLYPALPEDPGHALWKRDLTGASGLFGVELKNPMTKAGLAAMLDHLKHFGMGFSWGGYESLVIAYQPSKIRSATQWDKDSWMLRFHIGLEAPKDLIEDLDAGFARLRAALKKAA